MSQFHFTPDRYLDLIKSDLPHYDELQDEIARVTAGRRVDTILDLGFGTGETSRHVLERHPHARVTGIDASADMLAAATVDADLRVARLEDPLPEGPFDLVVSALAVHHLTADDKRDLFRRIHAALAAAGLFVLGDVVVPDDPADAVAPLTPDFDRPERLDDLVAWLGDAGFDARVTWTRRDLAAIAATKR